MDLASAYRHELIRSLRLASGLMAAIFIAFALFNAVDFEPPVREIMVAFDLALVALNGAIYAALGKERLARFAPFLGAIAAFGAAANVIAAMFLLEQDFYTTYLLVVIIATGYLHLDTRFAAATVASIVVAWYAGAQGFMDGHGLVHNGATLAVATSVSAAMHLVRRGAIRSHLREGERYRVVQDVLQARTEELDAAMAGFRAKALEAQSASQAKSRFLANLSHEIRTPLNGVVGLSELLLEEPHDARQQERLELLRSTGLQLLDVVGDVLDMAAIEAGTVRLDDAPFELLAGLRDVCGTFEPRAFAKGVELRLEVGEGVPERAIGDGAKVRQILTNLVGNALKFTDRGSVVVRCDWAELHPGEGLLVVAVRDTGVGMTAGEQAVCFDAFQQGDGSASRVHGGTGLGLAISKAFVDGMGGRLTVSSEPGVGSTFGLQIPLQSAAQGVQDVSEVSMPVIGARVLLVEDNPTNRAVGIAMLESAGAVVLAACDGREAVSATEDQHFDLVLMDCQMPVMDGYEATRLIRERERAEGRPRLRIVALTAHALVGERERVLAAGMDDLVTKPARQATLRALVRGSVLPVVVAAPSETLLDPQSLDELASLEGASPGLARELLASFRRDVEAGLASLPDLLAAGDVAGVTQLAHRLKGASASIGASALQAAFARLEDAGRCGDLDALTSIAPELGPLVDRTASALEARWAG